MNEAERVANYLGGATRTGNGWKALCPCHADKAASLSLWIDGNGILAWHCYAGCEHQAVGQAISGEVEFDKVHEDTAKDQSSDVDQQILPVPAGMTNPRFNDHKFFGVFIARYPYYSEKGELLAYTCRYEKNGVKTIRQRTVLKNKDSGALYWGCRALPLPRPMYNLPQLIKMKDLPVIVTEGEKAANAGQKIFYKTHVVVAWSHGANSHDKTDLTVLEGRTVILWPDNDKAGLKAMCDVAKKLEKSIVTMVQIPDFLPEGWDLADPAGDLDLHKILKHAGPVVDYRVAEVNRQFAYVTVGSDDRVIEFFRSADAHETGYRLLKLGTFRNKVANWPPVIVGKRKKEEPIAEYWLKHPDRLDYSDIKFYPGDYRNGSASFNPWSGFATQPSEAGTCETFKKILLQYICGGDQDLYNWIFTWIAHIFQKPWEKPQTSLVILGEQGAGKTFIGDVLRVLLGQAHYTLKSSIRQAFAQFNDDLETKLLFHFDEAVRSDDKSHRGMLLDMVTGKTMTVEGKFLGRRSIISFLRVLITSEKENVVYAPPESRRFTIAKAIKGPKEDYLKAIEELRNGGYGRLMHELRSWDLGVVDAANVIYDTDALNEQKTYSWDSLTEYFYVCLHDKLWSGEEVIFEDLKAGYYKYCTDRKFGGNQNLGPNIVARRVKELFDVDRFTVPMRGGRRVNSLPFTSYKVMRANFDKLTRAKTEWPSEGDNDTDEKTQKGFKFDEKVVPFKG